MSSFAILSYPLNPNRDAWLLKRCMNQNTADTSKVVETWVLKTAWFLTHSFETHVLVAPLWREVTYSMSLTEDCITVYSTPEVIQSTFHHPHPLPLPSSLLPTPFFPFPLNTHLSPPRSFPFPLVSTGLISNLFHSPSLTISFLKLSSPSLYHLILHHPPPHTKPSCSSSLNFHLIPVQPPISPFTKPSTFPQPPIPHPPTLHQQHHPLSIPSLYSFSLSLSLSI